MKITIEVVDRNYEQIRQFCDYNGVTVEDYCLQCMEDDFFTRKYGDINKKIKGVEKESQNVEKEVKKVGIPRKKVEMTNDLPIAKEEDVSPKEEKVEKENIEKKIVKTKRILKAK